jgi:drug/metabolite transporter (DMT)-like permease
MNEPAGEQTEGRMAAIAALLAVQGMFGSLPVIGKVVLQVIPPIALVGFRVGIAAAALFIFQLFRRRLWLKNRGDYLRLAVLSVFGVTLNQLLFIGGLSFTRAANTSLLAITIPVFTLVVGAFAGTETLRRARVVGVALAASGVVILLDPRNASFSSATTLGDILIILNSLSFGIYVATSKDVVVRNGPFRSMMWVFIFAALVCVPLGAWSMSSIDAAAIESQTWMLVGYIAIVATTVPYLLNAYALARVGPATVTVFVYLQPLIGFLAATIFLGESIGWAFACAAALIFAGVYLVTKRPAVDG